MSILKNFVNPWESTEALGSQALGTEALEGNVLNTPAIIKKNNKVVGTGNLFFAVENADLKAVKNTEGNKNWEIHFVKNIYEMTNIIINYEKKYGLKVSNFVYHDHGGTQNGNTQGISNSYDEHALLLGNDTEIGDGNTEVNITVSSQDIEGIYETMENYSVNQEDAENILKSTNDVAGWGWIATIAALKNLEKISSAMKINGNMIFTGCGLGRGPNLGNSLKKRIGNNINIFFNADLTSSSIGKYIDIGIYEYFILDMYLTEKDNYEYGWVKFPTTGGREQIGNIRFNSSGRLISYYRGVQHISSKTVTNFDIDGKTGQKKNIRNELVDTSVYEPIEVLPLP